MADSLLLIKMSFLTYRTHEILWWSKEVLHFKIKILGFTKSFILMQTVRNDCKLLHSMPKTMLVLFIKVSS